MTNCLHNSLASNLFRFLLYFEFFQRNACCLGRNVPRTKRCWHNTYWYCDWITLFGMNNDWNLIAHKNVRHKISFSDSHSFTMNRTTKLSCYQLCKYFHLNTRRHVICETIASLIEYVREKQFNKILRPNNKLKIYFRQNGIINIKKFT